MSLIWELVWLSFNKVFLQGLGYFKMKILVSNRDIIFCWLYNCFCSHFGRSYNCFLRQILCLFFPPPWYAIIILVLNGKPFRKTNVKLSIIHKTNVLFFGKEVSPVVMLSFICGKVKLHLWNGVILKWNYFHLSVPKIKHGKKLRMIADVMLTKYNHFLLLQNNFIW